MHFCKDVFLTERTKMISIAGSVLCAYFVPGFGRATVSSAVVENVYQSSCQIFCRQSKVTLRTRYAVAVHYTVGLLARSGVP